ncbi:MAG: hypothetical protein ACRDY1_14040, partial [Acidimicrobiales bacterium]
MAPRARSALAATSIVLVALLLQGCAGSAGPSATITAYLSAWTRRDYRSMAALVQRPPADFVTYNERIASDLDLSGARYDAGPVTTSGSTAVTTVTSHLVLAPFGPLTRRSTLQLTDVDGSWRVAWSTRSILSALGPGQAVATSVSWPDRAPVLGAGGAPLTTEVPMVSVGIQGSRITGAAAVTAALALAGATTAQVTGAMATATAHPQWFVPVVDVTQARYAQLKSAIYPV